ncbi:MAG TPA: histidine phosphatase family protein [Nannocystis sp.]
MSKLLLIRHGQASLGAPDYDVLSPLGVVQARRLGTWLAAMQVRPDRIVTGPRKRQRDTAAHLVATAREGGAAFPDPIEDVAFDEYPALEIMQRHLQRLAADDAELGTHLEDLQRHAAATREHRRAFEATFQRMMRHWHDDRLGDPEIESCTGFQDRVRDGLTALSQARGQTVLVVTSAGPVGVGLRLGLDLDPWSAIKSSFVVHNSSLTELRSRGSGPILTSFNALPHLHDPAEITLR